MLVGPVLDDRKPDGVQTKLLPHIDLTRLYLLLDNRRTSSEHPNGYTQFHGCGFPYLVAVIRSRTQLELGHFHIY